MSPLENNKQTAINFYRMAYLGEPAQAVDLYVGDQYIQHNPLVADGKQAFIEYFTEMHFPPRALTHQKCYRL
jgi:predicted SnoaL-like aldol condensation-catalyzing enzyme